MSEEAQQINASNCNYPDFDGLVDAKEELDISLVSRLKPIANNHKAIIISLIAPFMGKKTSPIDMSTASIRLWEELSVEKAVTEIREKIGYEFNKLFLLVESPGGSVTSSYKIAHFLRENFNEIIIFVPHQAASGGTLISMIGNEVVLGDMASLTPIDIQIPYGDTRVSVNRMQSALKRLNQFFQYKTPAQVPYPYQSLVHKLDPIIYDDWESRTFEMATYAIELLRKSGYDEQPIINIIENFVYTTYPHDFVINRERAINYGIKVAPKEKYIEEMKNMTWLLSYYVMKSSDKHHLRYILPDKIQPKAAETTVITSSEVRNILT